MNACQELQVVLLLKDSEEPYHTTLTQSTAMKTALEKVLQYSDNNTEIRRIVLNYPSHWYRIPEPHHDSSMSGHMPEALDIAITPRPWWRIVRESLPGMYGETEKKLESEGKVLEVILERALPSEESHLRFLASVQYPADEEDTRTLSSSCNQSMLVLNKHNMMYPGWSAGLSMYYQVYEQNPFAVIALYVSESNQWNDSTGFIFGKDCPKNKNKWTCAFLPSTTCTLPKSITECKTEHCVSDLIPHIAFSTLFTHAIEDGELLPPRSLPNDEKLFELYRQERNHPHNELQQSLFHSRDHSIGCKLLLSRYELNNYLIRKPNLNNGDPGETWMPLPKGEESMKHYHNNSLFFLRDRLGEGMNLWRMNFIDHYLLRTNAFHRHLVTSMLINFTLSTGVNFMLPYHTGLLPHGDYLREQVTIGVMKNEEINNNQVHSYSHLTQAQTIYDRISALPHGRCVAAYIRRGDRVPRDENGIPMNYTEYCEQNQWDADKGCQWPWAISFASVTLLDYLRKAETLVDIRHVHYLFVNTDERPWLAKRVEEWEAMSIEERREKHGIHGNWTVIYFPLAKDDNVTDNYEIPLDIVNAWRRRGGTPSGLHFFAALEMMRQCEAFVGHFQSAMSTIFYEFMCARHRELRNLCPPRYDFSLGDYI